jgi:hypothetical protein
MSENTPPKFFPQVVVFANFFDQKSSKDCGCAGSKVSASMPTGKRS